LPKNWTEDPSTKQLGWSSTVTDKTHFWLDDKEYKVRWRTDTVRPKSDFSFLSNPEDGWVAYKGDNLYVFNSAKDGWLKLDRSLHDGESLYKDYVQKHRKGREGYQFKTGGLADFTGPAWLDGTPSKPEYILNAKQTERFFSLIDVLESYDTKSRNTNSKNEISVDVDINVENISNDYDVEQMANKIRSMLYDDAMYRNVNNINLTR